MLKSKKRKILFATSVFVIILLIALSFVTTGFHVATILPHKPPN